VVFARHAFSNGGFHQPGERWENVDRWVYLSVMQLTVHKDLSFRDISRQVEVVNDQTLTVRSRQDEANVLGSLGLMARDMT
jgi:hypothetical protein